MKFEKLARRVRSESIHPGPVQKFQPACKTTRDGRQISLTALLDSLNDPAASPPHWPISTDAVLKTASAPTAVFAIESANTTAYLIFSPR